MEKVRERLLRAATVLERAGIPYAVIGGNAVAAWVATVDEAAVRNTRDVDILMERKDFAAARRVLEAAGFTHRHTAGIELFLDSPEGKVRDAVHVIFGG
ncbi:MAG: nucleotidyltransferase family protein, partial [bacterium]